MFSLAYNLMISRKMFWLRDPVIATRSDQIGQIN